MKDLEEDFEKLRAELDSAQKPLLFFDDDPDGLSSFLLCYRYLGRGKGIIIKSTPRLTASFANKAEEYGPDKVFALDLPLVDQEFIDVLEAPFVWVDHHEPQARKNLVYLNPRTKQRDVYYPVSLFVYNAVKRDVWIAATGVAGDFKVPPFLEEFKQQYPGYVNDENTPEDILFKTKLGKLVDVFSMILKGPTSRVMQCIRVLTRVEHPDEIIHGSTPRGRFIFKYYKKYRQEYDELLQDALKSHKLKGRLLLYEYPGSRLSLTSDLAGELIYRFPDKVVIVARQKSGEMKLSVRSRSMAISKALKKALVGVDGYGGGHEHACGANVKQQDFQKFLEQFEQALP